MTTWFITGASRGFGVEIAREALARGHRVAATARTAAAVRAALSEAGEDLLALSLDVTDPDQAATAVAAAVHAFGRIDAVVNNAGRGLLGAVEEVSDAEARGVFDVNVFGLLTLTRAVLPVLRRQRAGKVFNISSSGGFVGRTGWGVYSATKFAVEGLSEALRQELRPLGVGVTLIEPGGFRTDFLDSTSLSTAEQIIDDYAETAGAVRGWARESNHAQAGDPAKAAAAIVDLAELTDIDQLPERLQLGQDCFTAVADKLVRVAAEQETWRRTSVATAFDSPTPATDAVDD